MKMSEKQLTLHTYVSCYPRAQS